MKVIELIELLARESETDKMILIDSRSFKEWEITINILIKER